MQLPQGWALRPALLNISTEDHSETTPVGSLRLLCSVHADDMGMWTSVARLGDVTAEKPDDVLVQRVPRRLRRKSRVVARQYICSITEVDKFLGTTHDARLQGRCRAAKVVLLGASSGETRRHLDCFQGPAVVGRTWYELPFSHSFNKRMTQREHVHRSELLWTYLESLNKQRPWCRHFIF